METVEDEDVFMDTEVEYQPPKEKGSRVKIAGVSGK